MVKDTISFKKRAEQIHGNLYGYDKVEYVNTKTKVNIYCNFHQEYFLQAPTSHLSGKGCKKCGDKNKGRTCTFDKFLKKATLVHEECYNYDKVDYQGMNTKVKIFCNKHQEYFEQLPKNHIYLKHGCPKCGAESGGNLKRHTTESFIKKAKLVFGELYDYSCTNYVNAKTKIAFECKKHGIIKQLPSNHLQGHICKKCAGEQRGQKNRYITSDVFKQKAENKHNNLYTYPNLEKEFENIDSKITACCPEHGDFKIRAWGHLSGAGCQKCANIKTSNAKRKSHDDYIKEVSKKHNNKYDYSLAKYKGSEEIIQIICPIEGHGIFEKKAGVHLIGQGCLKCAREDIKTINRENPKGWSYSSWEKSANKSKHFDSFKVYVIKCRNEKEEFFKIGRTYLIMKKRFPKGVSMPYPYEIIKTYTFETARECCEFEQKLKNEHKEHKYLPLIEFGGMYECFSNVNVV